MLLRKLVFCRTQLQLHQFRFANSSGISFQNVKLQKYLESIRQEFYELRISATSNAASYARMCRLNGVVNTLEEHHALQSNLAKKEDIENEKDEDMRKLIEEENKVYTELLLKKEEELMSQLLTITENELYPSLFFEINSGAGGQEAMLFTQELYDMYTNYFEHMNWDYKVLATDVTDIGGLRHANIIVNDQEAFNWLRFESGVHRVQRVPTTEKSGRIHTSTVSITIIPRPADIEICIAEKDLKIETKRASGAGGQHVNTTDSAIRIVHIPTGIAVESQSERSQIKNREIALKRLQAKLEQRQLEQIQSRQQATRKAQQGTMSRNEKIRTYNYVQDRITDHRIQNGTMHNLSGFLQGGDDLGRLIERLMLEHRKTKLLQLIEEFKEDVVHKQKNKNK